MSKSDELPPIKPKKVNLPKLKKLAKAIREDEYSRSQKELIDFIDDPKTIAKAAGGSMDKRNAVMNTGNEMLGGKICVCELAEPCMSQCTCANGVMSGGCLRCATYGSAEQREASAKRIAVASSAVQPPNQGDVMELDEIFNNHGGICMSLEYQEEAKRQIQALVEQQVLIGRKAELENFKPLQTTHESCIDPFNCIGYQNAASDFDNEKAIRITEIDRQIKAQLTEGERNEKQSNFN